MFVHESKLRHLLHPHHYFSPEHHQRELERLLYPAWHPVASVAEVPRPGDFVTRRLMDRPLLVRNTGDEVNVYLNVCAHRHCMLTDRPKGNDPHFRCQYHGWEYTAEGRTGKIPDAGSFRPFDRENARLKRYRTARCGDLVFVSLADEGPSLHEFLGEHHAELGASFSPPWRMVWTWELEYDANWKIPLENGVESYHIPCVHPKTFKNYPAEPNVTHELHPTWTSYRTDEMDRWAKSGIWWTMYWLGLPFRGDYTHLHLFPNQSYVRMDNMRMAQPFFPTSPTTSSTRVWVYAPFGPCRGILPFLHSRTNAWAVKEVARAVLKEDAPIFPATQRGLEASLFRGVIGRREERIHAFQEYIARKCGVEVEGAEV